MTLDVSATPVPLKVTPDGKATIGGTRVTLDTVVFHFNEGATPEEILQRYPVLALADIYVVLSFYLNNREHVDAFLVEYREKAKAIREELQANSDTKEIRERLLARRRRAS